MLWKITGYGNEGSRNLLLHIKYIIENKDTNVSFYLNGKMKMWNVRYTGCLKPVQLENNLQLAGKM